MNSITTVARSLVTPKDDKTKNTVLQNLWRLYQDGVPIQFREDQKTKAIIVSVSQEIDLELINHWFKGKQIDVSFGKPEVDYRYTIRKRIEGEGKFIRQTGGRGHYGHVWVKFEPLERTKGIEFASIVKEASIPKKYWPSIKQGILKAMVLSPITTYSFVDIRSTLFDGSFHEPDSSEMAYEVAAADSFWAACRKVEPVLLEPMMKLEISAPEGDIGKIIGEINSRRGIIENKAGEPGFRNIDAIVPMEEMLGRPIRLTKLSEGSICMQFSHFQEVKDDDGPVGASVPAPIKPQDVRSGGKKREQHEEK